MANGTIARAVLVDGDERARALVAAGAGKPVVDRWDELSCDALLEGAVGATVVMLSVKEGRESEIMQMVVRARSLPGSPAIVVAGYGTLGHVVAALFEVGANAFLDLSQPDADLGAAISKALDGEGQCQATARRVVGRVGLKEALRIMRANMVIECLQRNQGSRRAAARELGVDRRYVQRLADALDEDPTSALDIS
ncbi:MAG: hypothetical protein OEZ06_32660 [Myxococcales bacterium]|nr:hypothetical protein [Myxococcales bacterium]